MLPSTRVSVPAASGSQTLVLALPSGSMIYEVHLTVVSGGPVDLGDSSVTAGNGWQIATGAAATVITMQAGDSLYASAAVAAVVSCLATQRNP